MVYTLIANVSIIPAIWKIHQNRS